MFAAAASRRNRTVNSTEHPGHPEYQPGPAYPPGQRLNIASRMQLAELLHQEAGNGNIDLNTIFDELSQAERRWLNRASPYQLRAKILHMLGENTALHILKDNHQERVEHIEDRFNSSLLQLNERIALTNHKLDQLSNLINQHFGN